MSSPYDILIEIQAKAQEVAQAAAAIQNVVQQATASGAALASGMGQGEKAAQALTQTVGKTDAAVAALAKDATSTGAAVAAGMDQGTKSAASTGAAVKEVGSRTKEAGEHALSFREAMEQAFAFGIGNQIVEKVLELPTKLIESFHEALHAGVEFNAEMEKLGIGIAGSLRQADPEHILNFAQAQATGSQAMDLLREKANQLGLDLHSLAETFQINLRAMTEGGVKSMEDQINLVLLLSQAAASKGLSGFQAQRDIIDLLAGKGDRTIFAKELGVTDEDIKTASQAGQLYQFLTDKLSAYGEAGAAAADTFGAASQRLHNQVEQLEGAVAKPLFDVLKRSANDLSAQLATADFQAKFSVIAQEIGNAARVALTFGAAIVPIIPTIIQATEVVAALTVALGVGALITALGNAATAAGGLGAALAPVAVRITAMLTALGPAGAIIGAATLVLIGLEHAVASFEARARSLLEMANQFGSVMGNIEKQIADADTPEKQAAAFSKLNHQYTELIQTREALKRQGSALDSDEMVAIENEITMAKAQIDGFKGSAGKGAKAAQGDADASKYPATVKAITDEDESQREANMTKEQAHGEAMAQFDQKRLEAAKALGLANDASYDQIRAKGYELMEQQNVLAKNKPQLIDTSALDAEVQEAKRQFEVIKTAIDAAKDKAKVGEVGIPTGPGVTPADIDPNYNLNIETAERLTGKMKEAMDALANAQAHNAQVTKEGTSANREGNAEAARALKTFQDLQLAYAKARDTKRGAQTEQFQKQQAELEDQLAKAKLSAGPNNITPEVQELMVKTLELKKQQEYLRQSGTLDAEHLKLAHDIAVSEVAVTVAKKDGVKASKDAATAARQEHQEEMAEDRDRKTALQDIRNQMAELKSNPFATQGEKDQGEKKLLEEELALLEKNIAERMRLIALYKTDPSKQGEVAKLQSENVGDQHTANQNKTDQAILSPMGQTKKQLTQLQSQWALTSQNIGKSITQNIETAVDSVSNAIDGLIENTHNWRQAFAQAGSAIIKNLIQLGVQMVVSAVLSKTLGKSAATESAVNSGVITAAAAPAAATTAVSTSGVSAIIGAALAIAAIAAIIAMASSHAEGGMIPGRPSYRDNRMAHVASGEYVVRTAAVQHYGPDFFHQLNRMSVPRTGFATGGLVGERDGYTPILAAMNGGGAPNVNVGGSRVTLIQPRGHSEFLQAMQSSEGKKIILGHVKNNRVDVGIRS